MSWAKQEGGERGDGTDLVDVRQDSSSGDGGSDERVEFLVSTNGELEMTRGNTLDSEILGGVSCETQSWEEGQLLVRFVTFVELVC